MNEEQVIKHLGFLKEKYQMNYNYTVFDNYLGTSARLKTYTFYNDNGCFVIHDVPVKGEVEYIFLENIEMLNQYGIKPSSIKSHSIDITTVEKEIWDRYEKIGPFKNPFFWINNNKVLKVLANVIEIQIQKTGEFYGIRIKNIND